MPGPTQVYKAAEMFETHYGIVTKVTGVGTGVTRYVRVTLDNVVFNFNITNFPDNCGAMIVSYLIPYMASKDRMKSILTFIDYVCFYGRRSGMVYTAVGDQHVLRKALMENGWVLSDVSYKNRNTGNRIYTFAKGVTAPIAPKKKGKKK